MSTLGKWSFHSSYCPCGRFLWNGAFECRRGYTPRFNFEGFINERSRAGRHGYTQIFRNGTIEATISGIAEGRLEEYPLIAGLKLEKDVFTVISPYLVGLRDFGVPPPLFLMITLEGVRDAIYAIDQRPMDSRRLAKDLLCLPECVLEDYGTDVDHHSAVRPAFDALWNAIGYARSQFFNEDGLWVGPR